MRILIAIEDSYFAGPQIEFVSNHNWPGEVLFNILHVVPPLPADLSQEDNSFIVDIGNRRLERGKSLVREAAQKLALKFPDAKIIQSVEHGYAKEKILEVIESWEADVAILGSHGRRELTRTMIGSVSTAVLTYALCSVLVVRPPKL
ncbi:MAG: universal stress protein [Candidatus Melainabacteria bacterium]|nr:universal stress protein [Candidatus Melainabacteria bacterium]